MCRLERFDPEGLPEVAPLVRATAGDGAICFDTTTYHYKSRRTDQAAVERRIKKIAETRVRYGYRRVHVLLRREGWVINPQDSQ